MTNTNALREWIRQKGLKLYVIAEALQVTPQALAKKINNDSEFKASEISVFVDRFSMELEDRDAIFFYRGVD